MRKLLVIIVFVIPLLPVISAMAADKVVVVPLGKNSAAAATAVEPWIKVYDANDIFVGYFVDGDVGGVNPTFYVISSKGYLADFQTGKNYGGYDWNPSVEEMVYLTNTCTDPMYVRAEQFALFRGGRPGSVFLSSGPLDFYIPFNATPVNSAQYYSGYPCLPTTPSGGSQAYYEMVQNDPAVTGFQNTYTVPFKAVFNMPVTP